MSYTNKVYAELQKFLENKENGKSRLARRLKLDNGIIVIFAVDRAEKSMELYVQTQEVPKKSTFPHWKGIEIGLAKLPEYGEDMTDYVLLKQTYQSEDHIFKIIVEDIRLALEKLEDPKGVVYCLSVVLTKWRNFFLLEKDIQLSPEREQGLLGELLFLKHLMKICGHDAVRYWTGCNSETHDFYINGNAIEVKTTAQKSPYKVKVSSEYQLDTKDVLNSLYLQFYALRKSENDGFSLQELVHEIEKTLITDEESLWQFRNKLEKYGYLRVCEELYQTGYYIRESDTYIVSSDFPRIEKSGLAKGLSNVSYVVNIDMCQRFLVPNAIDLILGEANPHVV